MTRPTEAAVEVRGCRLAYALRGEGPPVLWIQGVGVHGDGWLPQVETLATGYRCLTFDNRGMGRSQPVGAPVSVEQMADDALAVADAAGWKAMHLVGHSLGGLIALHLALTARPRVTSLALLCSFAAGRVAAPPTPRMLWAGARTRLGTVRQRRRAFLELVLPPAQVDEDRDGLAERLAPLFGHDLGELPAIVPRQLAAMRAYDARPRLAGLSGIPTLVVAARHDPIAPPSVGRPLAAGIPGARYVELADASHGVPITDPDRINGLLEEHFARAAAPAGRP